MPKTSTDYRVYVCSVTLPKLHFALLDFMIARLGKSQANRSDLIRKAIEFYILGLEVWDEEDFKEFVQAYMKKKRMFSSEDQIATFEKDVERFLTSQQQLNTHADTLGDVSELEISTGPSMFDY